MGKGGGGGSTTTIDYAYNEGMLELSQEQQKWAGEMFNMFKYGVTYDPYEEVVGEGGLKTTLGEQKGYDPEAQTSEMQYLQNIVEANQELLGLQTGAQKRRFDLYNTYMDDVEGGIDVGKRMDQAQANVQHGFKNANRAARMDIASYGLDPGSGRYASMNRERGLAEATATAGARTQAENVAEAEDFMKKTTALQFQ